MDCKFLNTFGKRLAYIMDIRDKTRQDVAQYINSTPNSISQYCNDRRKPDIETLSKIADFLHVNVDFLLMRNDDYRMYFSKTIGGNKIEITLNDENYEITREEIENLLNNISKFGFDVNKIAKKD